MRSLTSREIIHVAGSKQSCAEMHDNLLKVQWFINEKNTRVQNWASTWNACIAKKIPDNACQGLTKNEQAFSEINSLFNSLLETQFKETLNSFEKECIS